MLAHQASLLVASTCSCRDKMQIPQKGCKSAFDVPLNKQCINCVQRSCDNEPLLRTKDLQRHGWTTVFTHLPFANLLDKQSAAEIKKNMSACLCECAMHRSPENVREAKCLSTPLSQTRKHSFIVTLSVSRSRIALPPGSSAWVDGSSVLRTEKKTPPCWRWAWISSTSPMVPATASWYFCCMRVFSLCRRTLSPCHSWAFCKSGCLSVATVPAPPAVAWFDKYVFDQCSRSAAVATRSFWYFCKTVPLFDFHLGDTLSTSIVFQLTLENVFILLLFIALFVMLPRFVVQVGGFRCNHMFSHWVFQIWKQMGLLWVQWKNWWRFWELAP